MSQRRIRNDQTRNNRVLGDRNRSVQEIVKSAHKQLRKLMRQQADIKRRIARIKITITGMADLLGNDILNDDLLALLDRKTSARLPGFTKACRKVLREATRPLETREVCEQIQQLTPPVVRRHKDPLACVTTVLNRLVEYGEAEIVIRENGRRTWRSVFGPHRELEAD
jgi:hypothetical protein